MDLSPLKSVKAMLKLPFAEEKKKASPEIWAIGGGKGGTGKSFVTSCIGMTLSGLGKRTVLLDADIGGANLHSFLGMKRAERSLADFFERKMPLQELIADTGHQNLRLVLGDVQSTESDTIKYAQKQKLYRHIKDLDADYLLIDLGAGVHLNTIDTFLLADRMVVVTVPAVTAIENLYQFIRNVFFRKLKAAMAERDMRDYATDVWQRRHELGISNLRDLTSYLRTSVPELEGIFATEIDNFRIHLVFNQVRSYEDIAMGVSVRSAIRKVLGFHAEYSGYVHYDDAVLRCLNKATPFMRVRQGSMTAREVERLVWNIRDGNQVRDVVMSS